MEAPIILCVGGGALIGYVVPGFTARYRARDNRVLSDVRLISQISFSVHYVCLCIYRPISHWFTEGNLRYFKKNTRSSSDIQIKNNTDRRVRYR